MAFLAHVELSRSDYNSLQTKDPNTEYTVVETDGTLSRYVGTKWLSGINKIEDEYVKKVVGKGLSSNDFTNADKNRVNQIPNLVAKDGNKVLSEEDFTTELRGSLLDVDNRISLAVSDKVIKNNPVSNPGTFTKITFDSKGLVTGGASLAAGDIPVLAASKITTGTFDTNLIPTLAQSKVTNLETDLGNRVVKNTDLGSGAFGTFTKITFDKKGLVTGGTTLSETDIPELAISKITDLQDTLNDKVGTERTVLGFPLSGDITLVNVMTALTEASTDSKGLMSAQDKVNLETLMTLLGTTEDDQDDVVNTIREVLAIFAEYPEEVDLITMLETRDIDSGTWD